MGYFLSAENIYNQMKVNVTNVDTSENSYIYNSSMPSAMQISYALLCLDEAEKKVFASTALSNGYSVYLEKRVSELGLTRKTATYAKVEVTFTGKVGTVISQGSIVSTSDNRLYTTVADATIGSNGTITCYVQADSSGSGYNVKANDINYLPVKYSGITSVTNTEAYSSAIDSESDDDLYTRYLVKVRNSSSSGNKTDYETWALSVTGVGAVIVQSLVPTTGCVTVIILNSNKTVADQTLIDSVDTYINSVKPIGCTLYVQSAIGVPIDVSVTLTLKTGYILENVKSVIEANIISYLQDIALEQNFVSYAKIGAIILETDGVSDYASLLINSSTSNISISDTSVAILGTVTIS